MDIGFIGAGRVACSLGKYLSISGIPVTGYYDTSMEAAKSAADFTQSKAYGQLCGLTAASSCIFITTPDSFIQSAWQELKQLPLEGKIICHCSGALSADAFTGIESTQAFGCSLHPMLPFSSRFSSYGQLNGSFFTIEGQESAVGPVSSLFTALGNTVCRIDGSCKPKYHTAASILSNQVIAVLDTGYRLLGQCGFCEQDAIQATAGLIRQNIENTLSSTCTQALTGPIERNDIPTVQKHLSCLSGYDRDMYQILGLKLIEIAQRKNPGHSYEELRELLENI